MLKISAWDFFPASANFTVSNPNSDHTAVSLAAEGDGGKWIQLSEQYLVLAPNESREVSVRAAARRGGEFRPVIAIQQQALEGDELGIAAGIKLPVEIHSRAVVGPLAGAAFILLVAVTLKFLKMRINKTRQP